ncbi:MAG: hypothetical protein ABSG30_14595 [Steroidobacteraceae bacterium]|jgi:hypothetical protein
MSIYGAPKSIVTAAVAAGARRDFYSRQELLAANQVATKAAGDRKIVNELTIKQNYPNAP